MLNLTENDGPQGASKTFADVAIKRPFKIGGTKYAKITSTTAVRLDTGAIETIDPGQGVYEFGAHTVGATYPQWSGLGATEVARLDGEDVMRLDDGSGLVLSTFDVVTPGSGDPIAVATNVDINFDP